MKIFCSKWSVVCIIAVCSLTKFVYLTADETVQETTAIRDDRWGSSTENWQLISSSENSASGPGVKTYMKSYPGTQLSAFRGVGTLDVHISIAMGLFCDFNLAYEWVAMLDSIQSYPHNATAAMSADEIDYSKEYINCQPHGKKDVVHQNLKIPWPISPREIVLEREFRYLPPKSHSNSKINRSESVALDTSVDGTSGIAHNIETDEDVEGGGVVIVRYHSIEDSRIPLRAGRIRAESPLTMWRFQDVTLRERAMRGKDVDLSKRYTEIEVQVLVDSKGYIPVWFINSIQRLWPARAMSAFNKLIKTKDAKGLTAENANSDVCINKDNNSAGRCAVTSVKPFQPVAHW